ncbi:MAG: hypothetical protein JSW51_14935 [Gemmatimonadota bacterium]|nr:MAG: hypothetical protein JSW51_14935 [Gemmatimonadota bacterium]
MSSHYLVVSNPPHGSADAAEAAVHLGMTPAEARMKINFCAPEIWFTDSDREPMTEMQSVLAKCGVSTMVLTGQDLLTVPKKYVVESFAFGDSQMVAKADGAELTLGYDAPIMAVYCKPAAEVFTGGGKRSELVDWGRPSSSVMLDRMSHTSSSGESKPESTSGEAFLDFYLALESGDRRVSFMLEETDFSSLPIVGRYPLQALVAECERRFPALTFDRRLENVRVRSRAVIGQPIPFEEKRKLFSFGSLALAKLLTDIAPELAELTQNELGSRLSYLMRDK